MFKHTLNSLKTNTFIITPNRRLASFLTKRMLAQLQKEEVLDLQICAWQDALLQCRLDHPLSFKAGLLSPWQSRFLWQGVIRQSPYADGFINLADTQKLAAAAVALCIDWQIDPSSFMGMKEESDVLIAWWQAYQARCHKLNRIDHALLGAELLRAAEAGELRYKNIQCYGFDTFTPLQEAILAALKAQGCDITINPGVLFDSETSVCEAHDTMHDVLSAIEHAKVCWEKNPNPELPIGIVIPDIQQQWGAVSALLERVFDPQRYIPGRAEQALPYNISSGMALYDHPAIGCASEILMLNTESKLSAQRLTFLLNTPYIHAASLSERAAYDLLIRKQQAMQHDMAVLACDDKMPTAFRTCLLSTLPEREGKATFTVWVDRIMALLADWGWPGERTLDSHTYQAVEQYYEVLTELRTLSVLTGPVHFETVLHQLISELKQTLFQPQTEDKPIQVLGMLEAAGLSFSHLWVCGMVDTVMPAAPNPNPFIPVHLQRQLAMPHATADREWTFAKNMMDRLSRSSKQVIFSHYRHSPEGYEMRPSYFVKTMLKKELKLETDYQYHELEYALQNMDVLECMPADVGVPVGDEIIRGGAALLQAQIACPFRAYAQYRLGAQSPEAAVLGLSMKSRGQVLHAIMQALMTVIQTSVRLQALSEEDEDALIEDIIQRSLLSLSPPLDESLRFIESQRLYDIVKAALQEERQRGAFVVKGMEIPLKLTLAGLTLNIRIDRWDETPDGALLIDYKTGRVDTRSWDPDNLDDPQLPLYASAVADDVAGLAYAILRKEEVAFKGQGIINIPGIDTVSVEDWQARLRSWHHTLTGLAEEVMAGRADVSPKYGRYSCEHCDLVLCCRIKEQESIDE